MMPEMRDIKVGTTTVYTGHKLRDVSGIHGYGQTVRKYKLLKPSKQMCRGCRDDFYNSRNQIGVEECWSFKTAEVVDKVGHTSIHVQNGPDGIMRKTLICWHAVRK